MAKTKYELKQVAVSELIPYANNSRKHNEFQINQIAASIKEFGFTNPILIDPDNGIIAGHGRVMAAQKLAFDVVPCIVLAGLTEQQKRAYVIADNQLALNAGWDMEMLQEEIRGLHDDGFDIQLTGFDLSDFEIDDDYFDMEESEFESAADPKKTDSGFVEFSLVMPVDDKANLMKVLNSIRTEYGFEQYYYAMNMLVEKFKNDKDS